MKKTFQLAHEKIKYPRMIESVKSDIRKYIKRERKKAIPSGMDYWDFDCKYGETEDKAKKVHLTELDSYINLAEKDNLESFYIEILAKACKRSKK